MVGSVDYAEADRIVRLLSPSHGRLSVLARGARRSKRRFAGALEPGNRIAAVLRPGRGELWHLDGATLLDGRLHARDHLERIALLLYACELCGGLSREQHPEARLYGLLDMALTLIDGVSEPPSALFRIALEAKALTFAGLLPTLDRCAACGEPLGEDPLVFDPAVRGVARRLPCRR